MNIWDFGAAAAFIRINGRGKAMVETALWILSLALALTGLGYFISDDLLIAGTLWLAANFTGLLAMLPGHSEGEENE